MTAVAVHDKQPALEFQWRCLRLVRALHPLKYVAIGRPATIACSKAPVSWGIDWSPAGVGVLRLGDLRGRQRFPHCADTLNRSYPLLPAVYDSPA